MTKQGFETALQQLTPRRREVLELFLAGESDQAIAQSLFITENTVRQHIRNILKAFNLKNDLDDDHSSQRSNLIALFAQYQPELLQKPVTEAENKGNESILLSNDSDNKQDACTPAIAQNNQDTYTTEYDPNFVGREDAIARLNHLIYKNSSTGILPVSPVTRICQIVAPGGQGKTTLARKYLKNNFQTVLEFTIAKETKDIASVESLLEEKLRQLGEEPGREFMVSLDRFKQKLQSQPIGVLIDNLEPALKLDGSGQFLPEHRRYLELLRVLSDSSLQSLTLITSRERLSEGLDITLYSLPSLTVSAWAEFWQYQGINNHITLIRSIHNAYGGNALAMKVLSNLIINDYQGNIIAYWQDNKTEDNLIVETAVANLIKEQFERLQNINLDAYNLLCRLGCYRYQDVPTVPEAGLNCLLWDVAENQHKRIIRVLKERALVEFKDGEYWLHPVVRENSLIRLQSSDEWETSHLKAANFWKVQETQISEHNYNYIFESCYHYLKINNLHYINEIIKLSPSENYLLYRIKAIQECVDAFVSDYLKLSIYAYVNNLRGKFLIIIGKINEGIEIHERIKEQAIQKEQNLIIAETTAMIGFCHLTLFEIHKSLQNFQNCLNALNRCTSPLEHYFVWAICGVAYSQALMGKERKEDLFLYFQQALNTYTHSNLSGWKKALAAWSLGETLILLERSEEALDILQLNHAFCESQYFLQIKEKSLIAIGVIQRINKKYEVSLNNFHTAITGLKKIKADADIPEAYFQLALTYQQMGDIANSQEYFNKAIYLWSPEQIDAPKQIERVKKAMNCEP